MNALAAPRPGALYTAEILELTLTLADFPLEEALVLHGDGHSRVCGSRLTIGLNTDGSGRIARVGARVTACAIGQASAALFLRAATGRDHAEIDQARVAIEAWLSGESDLPAWPGLAVLEPAKSYPARHPAILLPWKAALAALSNRPLPG